MFVTPGREIVLERGATPFPFKGGSGNEDFDLDLDVVAQHNLVYPPLGRDLGEDSFRLEVGVRVHHYFLFHHWTEVGNGRLRGDLLPLLLLLRRQAGCIFLWCILFGSHQII